MKKLLFNVIILEFVLLVAACSGPKSNKYQETESQQSSITDQEKPMALDALQEYDCKIIKEEELQNIKKSIYIQIPEQLTEKQLRAIADQIKDRNTKYQRLFIFYLLPDMKIGSGAWATTHYNPNLEIKIMGVNKATEEKLKSIGDVSGDVVGKWYDKTPNLEHSILIYEENGQFKMKETYKNGSEREKTLEVSKSGGKQKFVYKNNFGEYLLIENDGNLGIYDRDGLITIANKIK